MDGYAGGTAGVFNRRNYSARWAGLCCWYPKFGFSRPCLQGTLVPGRGLFLDFCIVFRAIRVRFRVPDRGSVNPRLQATDMGRLVLSVAKPNRIGVTQTRVELPDAGSIRLSGRAADAVGLRRAQPNLRSHSAAGPIDAAFSRNPKPPALAGGAFTIPELCEARFGMHDLDPARTSSKLLIWLPTWFSRGLLTSTRMPRRCCRSTLATGQGT
jgi:hypothetical protein